MRDAGAEVPEPRIEKTPQLGDYSAMFREAGNYRQFITLALPAAKAGDVEAQYYVYSAMKYCEETYRFYFKRRERVLSVDEAIAVQTNRGSFQYIDALKAAHARCHEINGRLDLSWGSADEWLARAARAGQPEAVLATATRIFLESEMVLESPLRKPNGEAYTLDDARAMVRSAARSGHPTVLFELGELGLLMRPDQADADGVQENFAWRYVACLRGLDCSAQAEWHRGYCLADPDCKADEPGMDYLRRMALQRGITDLELRASVMVEKIEAGDWKSLGLAD